MNEENQITRSSLTANFKKIPKGWILPLLVAVYPIVFLYSHNVQILVYSQIVFPLIVACVGSLLLWALFSLIAKDNIKGGIIAAVFVGLFFAYGTLFDALISIDLFEGIKHRHFLPITLFIAGYIGYFIAISKRTDLFRNAFKIASYMVVFLLIINVATIIPVEIQKSQMGLHRGDQASGSGSISGIGDPAAGNPASDYPDIYYIVLDEYASFETLETVWGYDNSEFKDFLEDRGFFVAEKSRTHSLSTIVVVPSILNMRPITDLHYNDDRLELISLINDNKAMSFFSKEGYATVAIGNFPISSANYIFQYKESVDDVFIDDFQILLNDMTMMRPFHYMFGPQIADHVDVLRISRLYDFQRITQLHDVSSPKFVYAHILLPHEPFIFNKAGDRMDWRDKSNYENKNIYLEQLIFTTKQIETVIDSILKLYPQSEPPIIIIQSDHGLRTHHDGVSNYMPEDEPYKIINAFLLPGYDYKTLENDISPIDILPLVFETYLNITVQPAGD